MGRMGQDYFPVLMYFFSGIMAVEVVIGYLRLKRGIRRKYDSEIRFTDGDPLLGSPQLRVERGGTNRRARDHSCCSKPHTNSRCVR
jgi:hypothetical protein